ncbi:MAG: hypothetical protein MJ198_07400 [Bacteroidales bacterium]|nr:hypothetical protein [Bacteroidales bacterium]
MINTINELECVDSSQFPLCEFWVDLASKMFIEDDWITLYNNRVFAIMASDDAVKKEMKNDSWIVNSSMMRPAFQYDDGTTNVNGLDYPNSNEVFPIVITQEEKGYYTERVRLIDTFVLFYDLRSVERLNGIIEYYQLDENGDDILVAYVNKGSLKIKASYIKEFITIKDLNLIIQFDAGQYSNKSLEELKFSPKPYSIYKTNNLIFSYFINKSSDCGKTCSFIRGKSFILHDKAFIKRLWDYHGKKFEEFIAGKDENERPIYSTCDEKNLKHLGNFEYGKPWQMSLVFFRREVLQKYYSDTTKYNIQDGYISGLDWSCHIDNDRDDEYVVMVLKDLGKMPYKEQQHWKEYNVAYPKFASLSNTTWLRWIAGNPCDTQNAPDLIFKDYYKKANKAWKEKYGFELYLSLARGDEHFFNELHSMNELNNDSTFDSFVLAITKVTIDSLNEKELDKQIDYNNPNVKTQCTQNPTNNKQTISGGIKKLTAFMETKNIENKDFIELLNKVQALRSSTVAHRKSTHPNKKDANLMKWFKLDIYPCQDVVNDIFQRFITQFKWISENI